MDGTGEYCAKQNKPIPKNQRLSIFSNMWMLFHHGGVGQERTEVLWISQRGGKDGEEEWG